MEDIIEEIVGEINDEYDDEERTYVKLNDRPNIFEAKTLLSDFYKIMKADPALFEKVEGDADTFGRFVAGNKKGVSCIARAVGLRELSF